jgi:hypothetical protein
MKRFHRLPLSLLAALCLLTAVRADIVILKTGEKIEGRIHDETADSIQIEYHLTPKIKDNKTLLKSDIKEIKKQTPAEVEFEERGLQNLLPTKDLLSASDYESIIQDKLRTYVAKYPGTPEAAQAEKIIATLAEEKSKVLSGQLKMESKWLDAATVKREQYNIEAYRQRMLIKSKEDEVNDLHYLNALREFEKLRTDYGASPYFALEIPDVLDLLKKYETQLNSMIAEAPVFIKKRDDGLRSSTPTEAAEARRKIDEEVKAYKAKFDAQTKAHVKWKDIYKYDVKGLQDALTTVIKERAQLEAMDLTALKNENESLMSIINFLADNKPGDARVIYEQLNKEQNMVNKNMLPGLLKQIEQKQKEATEAAKLKRTVVVTEPAPSAAPVTGPEINPVKKALEDLKAKQGKKGDTKDGPAADASDKDKGKDKKADDDKAAPRKPPTPVAAAPAPDEGGGISDYIPYIGGGLLIVILIAWFIGKRKKDKE